MMTEKGRRAKIRASALSDSPEDAQARKVGRKIDEIMNRYTKEYQEELMAYNLVIRGICTMQDLYDGTMTLEHVIKCTEALMIKSEIEGLAYGN
jgi:hypothetical protein